MRSCESRYLPQRGSTVAEAQRWHLRAYLPAMYQATPGRSEIPEGSYRRSRGLPISPAHERRIPEELLQWLRADPLVRESCARLLIRHQTRPANPFRVVRTLLSPFPRRMWARRLLRMVLFSCCRCVSSRSVAAWPTRTSVAL